MARVTQAPIQLLVVEDSDDDFALLQDTLRRQGILAQCHRVETREQMERALADRAFDAIISDHQLPAFSSLDALQTLRDSGKVLPFLIVSGTIGEDVAVEAMRAGADDFLTKGRLARLGAALNRALQAAQVRREHAQAQDALRDSEGRLRALSAYLQSALEQERKAIAREIHDDIGGMLTALRFDLDWLLRHSQGDLAGRAQQARDTVGQAMLASQRISRNLRPPVLEAGVVAALEWQVTQFRKRTGMIAKFSSNVDRVALDDRIAITVYRCVQEALTNVVKHAQASKVSVDLVSQDDLLSVEVSDNGAGLAEGALDKPASFGLRGMAERATAVGGWIDVLPSGSGTTILLTIQLGPANTMADSSR